MLTKGDQSAALNSVPSVCPTAGHLEGSAPPKDGLILKVAVNLLPIKTVVPVAVAVIPDGGAIVEVGLAAVDLGDRRVPKC